MDKLFKIMNLKIIEKRKQKYVYNGYTCEIECIAQLVEYLSIYTKSWGQPQCCIKLGLVAHICHPSTERWNRKVKVTLIYIKEFEAMLDCMKPKTVTTTKAISG